jgi:hypothetical protein
MDLNGFRIHTPITVGLAWSARAPLSTDRLDAQDGTNGAHGAA